jgi:hypothetical protein
MELVSKGLIWMERELDVKTEANIMKEKLHAVREKYQKANYAEIKGNNKSFIEWNEDLLSFCKANRVSLPCSEFFFFIPYNQIPHKQKVDCKVV